MIIHKTKGPAENGTTAQPFACLENIIKSHLEIGSRVELTYFCLALPPPNRPLESQESRVVLSSWALTLCQAAANKISVFHICPNTHKHTHMGFYGREKRRKKMEWKKLVPLMPLLSPCPRIVPPIASHFAPFRLWKKRFRLCCILLLPTSPPIIKPPPPLSQLIYASLNGLHSGLK